MSKIINNTTHNIAKNKEVLLRLSFQTKSLFVMRAALSVSFHLECCSTEEHGQLRNFHCLVHNRERPIYCVVQEVCFFNILVDFAVNAEVEAESVNVKVTEY